MPTVLQINATINTGSTGRIAEKLGKFLQMRGWESHIAFGRINNESNLKVIKIGSWLSVYFHVLITRLFDYHGFGSRRATKKLIRKISGINPDILHLHNLHGYYLHYPTLFSYIRKSKVQVVWTLHDCWAFTGHCAFYSSIKCNKWKHQCEKCPQKRRYPNSWLFDNSKENYNQKKILFSGNKNVHLVTVSNWLKQQVMLSFLKETDCKVIYNGIDIDDFYPRDSMELRKQLGLEHKKVILGVANVWDENKDFDGFIRLAKSLRNKFHVVLIGRINNIRFQMPKNVTVVSHTENIDQLAEYYSMADTVVNLSLEESFGMITAEALACGTPVVVYESTAISEVVNSNTGIVCERNDFNAIVKAINKICSSNKLYYKEKCVESVRRKFNAKTQQESYLRLYNSLLESCIQE